MRDAELNTPPHRVRDRVRMRPEGQSEFSFRPRVRQRRAGFEDAALVLRHHAGTHKGHITQGLRERKLPGR